MENRCGCGKGFSGRPVLLSLQPPPYGVERYPLTEAPVFPIDPITNGDDYRMLKESVMAFFPFFDTGAKDAARFFFGVLDPVVELHGGENNEP